MADDKIVTENSEEVLTYRSSGKIAITVLTEKKGPVSFLLANDANAERLRDRLSEVLGGVDG